MYVNKYINGCLVLHCDEINILIHIHYEATISEVLENSAQYQNLFIIYFN